jgi:hypothetical protein|tara:strand:+ start:1073 stop:1300 length:228 start_codon:yes stop_codon:yes gene_type:complete
MMQESEHSRGSMSYEDNMGNRLQEKTQPTTLDSLRMAYLRVVKRRKVHHDFLRVSKEMEERMSEDRPSTMFFYGL